VNFPLLALLSAICCVLTGGLHVVARKRGWVVQRRLGRNRHAAPPTNLGGFAFLLGFLLCLGISSFYFTEDFLLSSSEMISHHWGLALSLVWVWAAGKWGDGHGYPRAFTVLVLMVGGAIATGFGFGIHTVRVGERIFELGGFSIPATLVWIVVVSEFFRLFDGLDGLLVTLVLLAVGLQLAILAEEETYARLLGQAMIPPLVGLLPWRIYPARVELRGIGAFLPGFIFGALTMAGREKAFTTKAVLLPGFVLIAVFSLFCLWILEQRVFLPSRRATKP
jgi:UDP-GlcNAc:undecaprenyl-phosphate GlcNAc-1-phosphate transferase